MHEFHLVTEGCDGDNIEIDFTEFEIVQLINLCLRRKYNKNLGLKFAKVYIEARGKGGRENLLNLGLDPREVEQGFSEMKKLLGELH